MDVTDSTLLKMAIEDSLKKRYLYKASTNLVGFLIALASAGVVPRGLGPAAYGSFNFLSTFFSQFVGFFDPGTSTAFYTKLSQRPKESGLLTFYWGYIGTVSLVVFLLVALAFVASLDGWLWPGQIAPHIWMAALLGLLVLYNDTISKVVDGHGLTAKGEIRRIQQRVLGVGLLLLLFWLGQLDNLTTFFLYNYLILLVLSLLWWSLLKQVGITLVPRSRLSLSEIKGYGLEFHTYVAPLLVYSLVGFLMGLLDIWLLQTFGGSVQQGFYGLAYRIASICFLFTSAMTPLLTREFAIAFAQQDHTRMRGTFQRYIPMLYAVAAFFAVFVAIQADKASIILGGREFEGATLAVAIMSFYPIHQTYGQLTGAYCMATGRTKLFGSLGVIMMLIGLPMAFWLTAPQQWLGLNLGAEGLAIKMVGLQIISVNLLLWFSARSLGLSFWRFLWHQLYTVAALAGMAWLIAYGVDRFVAGVLPAFLISGLIYSLVCGIATFLFPTVLSVSRPEFMEQLRWLRQAVGKKSSSEAR